MRGDAGTLQSRVHGRHDGVHDGVARVLGQAECLVYGHLVELFSVAGDLGHGHGADGAAVAERHGHVAVAEAELVHFLHQPTRLHGLGVFLEVVFGVLAGLRGVGDAPATAKTRVVRVGTVHKRGLAALARRADHHRVIVEAAGVRVDLARHVGHVTLPRDKRRAHHPRYGGQPSAVRAPAGIAFGAASNPHKSRRSIRLPRRRRRRSRSGTCRVSSTMRRCTVPCSG